MSLLAQKLKRSDLRKRWQCSNKLITRLEKEGLLPVEWLGPKSPRYKIDDVLRLEEQSRVTLQPDPKGQKPPTKIFKRIANVSSSNPNQEDH